MESLFSTATILLLVSLSCFTSSSEALTSNKGNVIIKWDLKAFMPDSYIAIVTAYNHQKQRSIRGWKMSWKWARREVIWSVIGAQTIEHRKYCSKVKGDFPQSCAHNPTVVDMRPNTPFDRQIANCCKSGVLKPGSESAFQLVVGNAGSWVKAARMPVNFMFMAPKQEYICGPAKNVRPTRFMSADN